MGCFQAKASFNGYVVSKVRSELSLSFSHRASLTSGAEEDSRSRRASVDPSESEKFPTLRVLSDHTPENPLKYSKARLEERHRNSKRSVFANLQNAIVGSINFEEPSNFFDKADFSQFLSQPPDMPISLNTQAQPLPNDSDLNDLFERENLEEKIEASAISFELDGTMLLRENDFNSTPPESSSGRQESFKGFNNSLFEKENHVTNSFSGSESSVQELRIKPERNVDLMIHKPNERDDRINKLMQEYPEYELVGQVGTSSKDSKSSVDIRHRATGKVITFFV